MYNIEWLSFQKVIKGIISHSVSVTNIINSLGD